MNIVIIGGDGLIGKGVIEILRERGHTARAASPRSGANMLTGQGLAHALQAAAAVVDVTISSFDGSAVCVPPIVMEPIAPRDVSAALADVVLGAPLNGMVELGGPERLRMDDLSRRVRDARHGDRPVVADRKAQYSGTLLDDTSLVTADDARRGPTRFADWLEESAVAAAPHLAVARRGA